jgi:hypothetical protein
MIDRRTFWCENVNFDSGVSARVKDLGSRSERGLGISQGDKPDGRGFW